ncbi:MAG: hypothetical protein AABW53_00665 [Nanoarchaeota archaeon]
MDKIKMDYPVLSSSPQSAVEIIWETGLLRLRVRYGLQDQLVASDLADIFKKTGGWSLASGGQEFSEVCDLILQLYRPRIYRLDVAGAYHEQIVGEDDACQILDLRHNIEYGPFKSLRLRALDTYYGFSRDIQHINGIDAVFEK